MPSMRHRDVERGNPRHSGAIDRPVAVGQVIDQHAAIDRVAGKEQAVLPVEQADAARRMAGKMQYVEPPIAEVDDVSFLQRDVERCGGRCDTPP